MTAVAGLFAFAYSLACWWYRAPLIFAVPLIVVSTVAHLVEHNHVHCPVFRLRLANELFSLMLMGCTGLPVDGYRHQHVEIHHRFAGTTHDWTSPWAAADSRASPIRGMNLVRELICYSPRSWARATQVMWRRRSTKAGRRFWRSIAVLIVGAAVLQLLRPDSFMLFFVLPWLGNAIMPGYFNFRHHVGCDFSSPIDSANVSLGGISGSALGMNIGYHSVHHAYPALHWSELRDRYLAEFARETPAARLSTSWLKRLIVRPAGSG
jgi:fatty acid desaturase